MKRHWLLRAPLRCVGILAVVTTTSPALGEVAPPAHYAAPPEASAGQAAAAEAPTIVAEATKTSDGKLILGAQEWVYVRGLKENFKARVDTGATTSSISAVDVEPFERDGQDWVKFRIEHDDIASDEISLPVARWVEVRQSSSGEPHLRAVVTAWIQIGELKENTEFTLTDRTHLTFPLLLGRSFFKNLAIVDVSRNFVQPKHE